MEQIQVDGQVSSGWGEASRFTLTVVGALQSVRRKYFRATRNILGQLANDASFRGKETVVERADHRDFD